MPTLYHGPAPKRKKPTLFGVDMLPIAATHLYSHFLPKARGRLAPTRQVDVARLTWFKKHNTTALSWQDVRGIEHTVFLSGLHKAVVAVPVARHEFPQVIPSPTVFRVKRKIKKI
jgi:hypothetical protein